MKTMQDYLTQNTFDIIMDVREKDEFMEGHVKGAIHVPLDEVHLYDGDKQHSIALYCFSGRRASLAIEVLKKKGYHHLTNIGGVSDESIELVK